MRGTMRTRRAPARRPRHPLSRRPRTADRGAASRRWLIVAPLPSGLNGSSAEGAAMPVPAVVPDDGTPAFDMAAALPSGADEATAAETGEAPSSAMVEATAPDAAEAAGDDADRSKRRGRRGGRRRRRDADDTQVDASAAEPAQASPDVPERAAPAYAGPTPADPFGGSAAFDIFDAIEQAEQERALAATGPARRPAEPVALQPAVEDGSTEPEPVIAEPIAMVPETVSLGEPDPAVDGSASDPASGGVPDAATMAVPPAPESVALEPVALQSAGVAEPTPSETEAEPTPESVGGPVIIPTLIDGGTSPAEKRRGWWRR